MIDKNELRLGNYVFDEDNDICKICSLETDNKIKYDGMDYMDGFSVEYDGEDKIYMSKVINPIPLTEEWLVKFGAEIIKDEVADCAIFDRASLRLAYNDYDWHCSLGDDDTGILFRMIKHVHQLQNLYFALTGKELKLA